MHQHTLNDEDIALCKDLAKKRYSSNRKVGVKNQRVGKLSDEFIELQGVGGEFAFCRIFGLSPDETIRPRSAISDPGDVVLANGTKIDIKTTHYKNGKLLAVPWKTKGNTDYYALMVGTFPTFEFKGMMSRDDLIQESRVTNLGYGKTYYATQQDLDLELLENVKCL